MLDQHEQNTLAEALDLLKHPRDVNECYCEPDDGCTIDSPNCEARHLQAAVRKLHDMARPTVTTLHPERLTNLPERIYFEQAQRMAEEHPALNGGYSDLELILNPDLSNRPKEVFSKRDTEVFGTVIQWLGTNCGRAFIDKCERMIRDEEAERREWNCGNPIGPPYTFESCDWADKQADRLVSQSVRPGRGQAMAIKRVSYALRQMLTLLAFRDGKISAEAAASYLSIRTAERFMDLYQRAMEQVEQLIEPTPVGSTGGES